MLYVESINQSLHNLLSSKDEIVLIGEDLSDPYGGAFKASRGLSSNYPEQVISTPISEQAIVGAGIGMAMRGMKPIVEIMFGDFITLCTDQIVNHATKYNWMFNEQVNVPLVIRTPMGGGRGYGPTHSQSLESMFMTTPGLTICSPSIYHDPGSLLEYCVLKNNHPVLFIENKRSYPKEVQVGNKAHNGTIHRIVLNDNSSSPQVILLTLYPDEQPDIVIITYGGIAENALNASIELFIKYEIIVNVIVFSIIRPFDVDVISIEMEKTEKLLVLEEGNKIGGWGGEVISQICESSCKLPKTICRIGAEDTPIPASLLLEENVLPSEKIIIKTIKDIFKE